jgi:hypothetical protein
VVLAGGGAPGSDQGEDEQDAQDRRNAGPGAKMPSLPWGARLFCVFVHVVFTEQKSRGNPALNPAIFTGPLLPCP